ncbi:MAG: hypothetical protein KME23_17995 [Goleter apudmare HA4340-LM2]|nr:hypothetical protein [Goleter apudmare HA4340-LM2]
MTPLATTRRHVLGGSFPPKAALETRRQSPLPRGDAARTSRETRPRRCLPKAVAPPSPIPY